MGQKEKGSQRQLIYLKASQGISPKPRGAQGPTPPPFTPPGLGGPAGPFGGPKAPGGPKNPNGELSAKGPKF